MFHAKWPLFCSLWAGAQAIAVAHEIRDGAGDVREALHERELLLGEDAVARERDEPAALPGGHDDRRAGVELREDAARPVRAGAHQERSGAAAGQPRGRRIKRRNAGVRPAARAFAS